jgi:hypothetical protein
MYSLALIIVVVSEKKAFEHFPIGSNVKLSPAVASILNFISEHVSKCFFSETTWTIETKLPSNVHWMVLYKLYVFCSDMKFKMLATAGLSLTLDPMGKCSNAFFSETTKSRHFEFHIGTKNLQIVEDHPMNIHVQYGFNQFCSF